MYCLNQPQETGQILLPASNHHFRVAPSGGDSIRSIVYVNAPSLSHPLFSCSILSLSPPVQGSLLPPFVPLSFFPAFCKGKRRTFFSNSFHLPFELSQHQKWEGSSNFFLAFAAVVASQVRDGAPALGTSTSSLLVDAETSRASRRASTEIAHHLQTGEKVAAKSLESDGSRSRHDGKEIMHLWARQNSTPSSQPPLSLSTATLTRTSFIEVPSETQVVVSTLVETVTVVDPIFVTETSTVRSCRDMLVKQPAP